MMNPALERPITPAPPAGTRGLIFDCDGTLADTMPAHYRAWISTLQRFQLHQQFDEDRFYSLGGVPTEKIVAMLVEESGQALDVQDITRLKELAFVDSLDEVTPIAAIVQVADAHRGQLPMAVASGGLRHIVHRILTGLGIHDWFDAVVTAEDTERHKPEPDVFLEAARRLNVDPAACCVYEDTDLGITAARRAGMRWIDVRHFHIPARVSQST